MRAPSAGPTIARPTSARRSMTCSAEARRRPSGELPSLTDVDDALTAIAAARGAAEKATIFRALLWRCDALTAKYVVKVLGGDMRIGLREGHLEAAIAAAFEQPIEAVKWAGMLTGDIGRTAELARDGALESASLTLFRSAQVDARLAGRRCCRGPRATRQPGLGRGQVRRHPRAAPPTGRGGHASTAATCTTSAASSLRSWRRPAGMAWDGILDGELLAWKDGGALPFQRLQARLGRKKPPAALLADVPCIFVAFDALALGRDGVVEPLLRLPLVARRQRLDALGLEARPGLRRLAPGDAEDEAALEVHFEAAQGTWQRGARWSRTRRAPTRQAAVGYGWLKLKKPLATIDCVVVGVEVGHGKRHGVLLRLHLRGHRRSSRCEPRPGDHRQGLQRPDRCRDRRDDALVRGSHAGAFRALPRGRAARRGRDRLRRHHALDPPRVRLRAALPAHRALRPDKAPGRDRPPLDHRAAPRADQRRADLRADRCRRATRSDRRSRSDPLAS